jgi:hypothetical protein
MLMTEPRWNQIKKPKPKSAYGEAKIRNSRVEVAKATAKATAGAAVGAFVGGPLGALVGSGVGAAVGGGNIAKSVREHDKRSQFNPAVERAAGHDVGSLAHMGEFADQNRHFMSHQGHSNMGATPADGGAQRGWANPKTQAAAKAAQGKKYNGPSE